MKYGPIETLPIETARVALTVFNSGEPYIVLGDCISQILGDLPFKDLTNGLSSPSGSHVLLAMVTVMEYAEKFTDSQASEAARVRIDWKYALHLPLVYPWIHPQGLCEFRAWMRLNEPAQQVFQQILDRLDSCEALKGRLDLPRDATQTIDEICDRNRLMSVGSAMGRTLESIAACRPDWLRKAALPHWFERYVRMSFQQYLPYSQETLEVQACSIGKDALYLLEAIAKTEDSCLSSSPESQELFKIWQQQFHGEQGDVKWRLNGCSRCSRLSAKQWIDQEVP